MRKQWLYSWAFLIIITFSSCKNEENISDLKENSPEITEEHRNKKIRIKEFTPVDTKMLGNAMSRLLLVPDLKKFASFIVAAEMADLLSDNTGSFTVFAPPNLAFDSLTGKEIKFLSKPQNKVNLENLIKSHIVEGSFDSAIIFQTIKEKGQMKLNTLAGGVLIATIENDSILISDDSEKMAVMHKTDILSSNAIVHVLDQVLGLN